MNRRGFTIVELAVVITIMGILLVLGVVNLNSAQVSARDSERKTDIETIAQHLETVYSGGTDASLTNTDCTGGYISHDGLYTVHKFTASGTLNCTITTTAEVLVVAGGGGGGCSIGGGGGAGGYQYDATHTIALGTYTITVGDGGVGASVRSVKGNNGNNSVFDTITAIGGGGGGSYATGNGSNGGSGGGGSDLVAGGTGSQGGNGGQSSDNLAGGGGGGASANGVGGTGNGSTGQAGNGGVGTSNDIVVAGTGVYYAGGGGGASWSQNTGYLDGAGGNGGGGGGNRYGAGTPGTANTGGGGGGAGYNGSDFNNTTGKGGSGVVIVHYLTPIGLGTYPSTTLTTTVTAESVRVFLLDIDVKSITAPGIINPATTFISATNSTQTTAGVLPQPTIDQYVYQPIKSDGTLCTLDTQECRKFNLYYRLETDNTVYIVTSKNQ